MKNWFFVSMLMFGLAIGSSTGCGSSDTKVIEAPPTNVDPMPDVDRTSADYQKSMSQQ